MAMSPAALDEHLAGCASCAAWIDSASRLGRSLRVTGVTPPDLSELILAQVVSPAVRVARYRRRLRVGLAAIGLLQWALAVPALFGDTVGMQMAVHATHESAAWNLALGAAFLAVATKPMRAVGTLPILATFVAVLAVLSVGDIADGSVTLPRLASHLGIVVGLVLVFLMSRSQRLLPPSLSVPADTGSAAAPSELHRRGVA